MSTILRTLRNLRKVGLKEAAHQMANIGDTKAGTLIGKDRFGNKFYENLQDELPLRTRWVDYNEAEFDAAHIEPGWHSWMSYMVHEPPTKDAILQTGHRVWEKQKHLPNPTQSRAAYKPYSTVKVKLDPWNPTAIPRR